MAPDYFSSSHCFFLSYPLQRIILAPGPKSGSNCCAEAVSGAFFLSLFPANSSPCPFLANACPVPETNPAEYLAMPLKVPFLNTFFTSFVSSGASGVPKVGGVSCPGTTKVGMGFCVSKGTLAALVPAARG